MTTRSDAVSRVSGLLARIPGYRGYRDTEDRRDADRAVREHLATAYGAQATRVERVAHDLAAQRRIREIGPVDEFARTIRHLVDRISTATYGYGGLFSNRDVDATALDQLRRFDESLMSGVDELQQPAAALEQAYAAGSDLATPARAGTTAVRAILARLDLRNQVVETAKPAPEASVLAVLSPRTAGTEAAPPAFDLHHGDALAILGDNFVVDARIDLDVPGQTSRLFRVGADPERWLFVSWATGQPLALLQPASQPYQAGPESKIGDEPYTVNWSGSGSGEVTGAGGGSGRRAVSVTTLSGTSDPAIRAIVLDWGSERQVLVGKEVDPNDVEVYGAPAQGR